MVVRGEVVGCEGREVLARERERERERARDRCAGR
jgi:hypothetical protein